MVVPSGHCPGVDLSGENLDMSPGSRRDARCIGTDLVLYMVELLLGDSRELDANADSHCEPTFNREQDPSRRVSHPATCHALT